MKKCLLFIFLLFSMYGYAQTFNNSWIPFISSQPFSLQQYYKIKIVREGLYRLDKNVLLNAGIPIKTPAAPDASVDHSNLQLFVNGIEQALHIDTTSDANGTYINYIQFYGKGNDGALDSRLYINADNTPDSSKQANPFYSLFTDTASYFLTWNTSSANKRYALETDTVTSGAAPAPYFFRTVTEQYTDNYYHGASFDPDYIEAEGWFGNGFTLGGSAALALQTPNAYGSGPPANATAVLAGASAYSFLLNDHHVRLKIGSIQTDTVFAGYKLIRLDTTLQIANLAPGTVPFTFSSIDDWNESQNPSRSVISYIAIKYPHTYFFSGENAKAFSLYIPDNSTAVNTFAQFRQLTFPAGSHPVLMDLSNNKMIRTNFKNGVLNALIPNAGGEKKCYLTDDGAIEKISNISPVSTNPIAFAKFINYQNPPVKYDFIIVTHSQLMHEAIQYKNYRSLSHTPLLVDIDELYNQFSYGIAKHPLAIKNFIDFTLHTWSAAPAHLFLLGKSIDPVSIRKSPAVYARDLVPTYGYPSSDILLTAGLTTYLYSPSVPIGRLAAQTADDVTLYLNKVKIYENQAPAEWMKNVLHLGGGGNSEQILTFSSYLNVFKSTIMRPFFGAKVTSFFKSSSEVIQINQSDFLHALIDTGVSMITFFGHSNGAGFDQNIDVPSAYNNKNRYPLILANSCYAGDIHTAGKSVSEDFVLIQNKGAIGFIASISEGFSSELFQYSNQFYKEIAKDSYGKGIGQLMQKTIEKTQVPNYLSIKNTCLEMTLHGDPSVVINSPALPDLLVTPSKIFFTPNPINALADSFTVNIIATNIGKVISDSFQVSLKRTLPDGSTKKYIKKISMTSAFDTVAFILPVNPQNAIGLNTFEVMLDVQDSIRFETTKLNNIASAEMLIQSDEIIPVYPYKYAIIPNDTVTLKASTTNPFASVKDYIFQLDTTDAFDSPFLQNNKVQHADGGIVTWKPSVQFRDSLVYFWRVSPDSKTGNYKWRESSFTFKPDKTGWSQAHFFQFKNDIYNGIAYKKSQRTFDFAKTIGVLNISGIPNYPILKINGTVQENNNCYTPSILVVVVDPLSLEPWKTSVIDPINPKIISDPDHNFGNYRCANREFRFFTFQANVPAQLKSLRYMLSKIPNGFYIAAFTGGASTFGTWDDSTFKAFEALGATRIRSLNKDAYIFYTQKGANTTTQEVVGDSLHPIIDFQTVLNGRLNQGHIVSEIIGPASKWTALHWRQHPKENPNKDIVQLNVFGIKTNGKDTLLIQDLKPAVSDTSLSFIDEKKYPYLRLDAFLQDDSVRTPAELKKWQIYYTPKPEAALNPSRYFTFYKDNIDEGDIFKFSTVIENISPYDMDSMLVHFDLYDKYRVLHRLPYKKRRPLPAAGKRLFADTISIAFSTQGFAGLNSLWIEANPNNDQLEQYHFNNIGQLYFTVNKDKTNPLMDVTFDGVHILDGDIVSSKPFIVVQVHDENKFQKLDTSSLVKMYLKYPEASTEVLIPFDNTTARFIPAASAANNKLRVEFSPKFLKDGKYQLRIQSKDKSSNLSAYLDYKITFEVVNKSSITEVMNYPNPFSTSTRFVFTLTGAEVPTYFKIQIMTVSGKIIREVMLNELGTLHIGRNITEYAWDGKDAYGDRLANGLYIYHVITKLNESAFDKRESGADKYFNNGYGKMYLMR